MNHRILNIAALIIVYVFLSCTTAVDSDTITADKAKDYIGETKTVRGLVVSTRYAFSSRGRPTFLNLDKPYPNQIFTIVIWDSNRAKFDEPPESHFKGRKVRVTGKITEYRGTPQIVVRSPDQLKLD